MTALIAMGVGSESGFWGTKQRGQMLSRAWTRIWSGRTGSTSCSSANSEPYQFWQRGHHFLILVGSEFMAGPRAAKSPYAPHTAPRPPYDEIDSIPPAAPA